MQTLFLGTMGWSYPFWVGKLYPPNTSSKHFLEAYAKHFNTVEINNTFYRAPLKTTVKTWKSQTPADFQFTIKMPRKITHVRPLQFTDYTTYFFDVIAALGEQLGPILIQLPPQFTVDQLPIRARVQGDSARIEQDRSQELAIWAKQLRQFQENKLEIYGYFSKFYSGYPPADIAQLTTLLA
jgi:uncharacterized protein YecE (DUF72 family)